MNIYDEVKDRLPFEDLASSYGIHFDRSRKSLCPFHDEKTPSFSLHPSGTFAKCFGCDKSVDVIDLEYELGKLPSKWEAVNELNDRYRLGLHFNGCDKEKAEEFSNTYNLLERYCEKTHKALLQNKEALTWLEEKKGITVEDLTKYRIGYVGHGWLKDKVTEKSKALCLKVGLLKEKDGKIYDAFWDRLIFPVFQRGKIVSILTREFPDKENSNYKWLGLPNSDLIPNKPIAWVENLNCELCVITESITDVIAFLKIGIPACSLLGTEISEANRAYFEKAKAKLYFGLDPDEAGKTASYKLSREVKGYVLELGYEKDPDEIIAEIGFEEFRKLAEKALKEGHYYLDLVIEKEDIREALTEIALLEMESDKDLYLSKLSEKHQVTLRSLRKDLNKIIEYEELRKLSEDDIPTEKQNPLSGYTEEEIEKARQLIKCPDLLDRVVKITDKAGYVGEANNKRLTYLAFTSRKSPGKKKAISLIPKGESSSGKSELVKTVLKLIPKQDVKEFTFITEKALVHSKVDLSHKIVCVFERQGGEKADYTIRTAISEEKLSIFIPIKNPTTGDFESIEKSIPAEGMVYIETTTEEHIEPQNANRTFEFFTDSSPELTREVLRSQARVHNQSEAKLEAEFRIWRCMQELIESLPVYIPFAQDLAEQFPDDKVRARRDFPRLLALIEVSALLHQENRDKNEFDGEQFIMASTKDFEIAYEIIGPILSQTYKELSPKEEAFIKIIKEEYGNGAFADPDLFDSKDINIFSPKELLEKVNTRVAKNDKPARSFKAYNTLRKYLKKLIDKNIVEWNGEKGVKSKYILVGDIPEISFHLSHGLWSNSQKSESALSKTLALEEHGLSMANSLISNTDEPISPILDTERHGSSFAYKSLENLEISPLATPNMNEINTTEDIDQHPEGKSSFSKHLNVENEDDRVENESLEIPPPGYLEE